MYANDSKDSINLSSYNPYQAADVVPERGRCLSLLHEPNYLPASSGIEWIKHAWRIFLLRPLFWVGMGLCYIAILMVASWIPILNILSALLNIFLLAGMAYMAHLTDMGNEANIGDLFVGFKQNTLQLTILFLLTMVCIAVIVVPVAVVVRVIGIGIDDIGSLSLLVVGFVVLSVLLIAIPLAMAMFFAPILVLLHDLYAIEAMKLSFKACARNMLPFLVYAVVIALINVVAAIPLGLGYFVAFPLALLAIYASYQQILLG
ncbi:MAG: BPSS1780 family membrane protein [Moraxella sp.]|nr:BPSS1780 family membrane protein [Moraxella sp.]